MGSKWKYEETKMIRDIATIMAENKGPFTKKLLIPLLGKIYPHKSYQELKNEISIAILIDKKCNQRFKVVRPQVWDLKERVNE